MRILLIEDDLDLCEGVAYALEKEGYTVDACHEGDDGLRWMLERGHDLVLLDRMLPRLNGIDLLRRAREEGVSTPVLMMTALGGVDDRVTGLDTGADDYIVKPFAMKELLARIRALCRRPAAWGDTGQVSSGELRLDPARRILTCGERSTTLSKRESALLEYLLRHAGSIIPRSALFSHVWGPDAEVEDGNLDNYIYFVRLRLREVDSPLEVSTIRHTGYCLREKQA